MGGPRRAPTNSSTRRIPPEILKERLDHELFKCVIETQTPTCADLDEAYERLHEVRAALVDHAETHGYGIAAAGLHPAAKWRELEHAEKPRYRAQLNRIQYPQHRNTTAGIHVHVGVDDAEKATWIANEIRWFLPVILALSANSPFWNGFDTGLASARAKIFENLPNTGVPTAFRGFAAYRDFERLMVERGSINDRGELWYDVRPHTENGTVEVRAPDGQADSETVFAFVEYVHALVLDLAERYERESNPWATYRSAEPSDRARRRSGANSSTRTSGVRSATATMRRSSTAMGPEQWTYVDVVESRNRPARRRGDHPRRGGRERRDETTPPPRIRWAGWRLCRAAAVKKAFARRAALSSHVD